MDLVFYDGGCGFCHRSVLYLLRHDLDGTRFRYAPIAGESYRATFTPDQQRDHPDSIIVRTADGRTLTRGAAVLHLAGRIGGVAGFFGKVGSLLPHWLLDWGYDRVASVRKVFFATPKDSCPMLPPELKGRFLA